MRKVLKGISVLLTSVGCPGGPSVIEALQREGAYVIGIDADDRASGRFYVNEFRTAPRADISCYTECVIDLCAELRPNVLFPQSSHEVLPLALEREAIEGLGIKLLASKAGPINIALDKVRTYQHLEHHCPELLPRWQEATTMHEFVGALDSLGLWHGSYVVKDPIGTGSRGVRIIRPSFDRFGLNMRQWPNAITMTEEELFTSLRVLSRIGHFPRLMIMEWLHGEEMSADTFDLYDDSATTFGFTKARSRCREGLHTRHYCQQDKRMLADGLQVSRALGLTYFVNVQFMDGKLLEVNPRISTQFVTEAGYNMPAIGVAAALRILTADDIERVGEMPATARAQYYWRSRTY